MPSPTPPRSRTRRSPEIPGRRVTTLAGEGAARPTGPSPRFPSGGITAERETPRVRPSTSSPCRCPRSVSVIIDCHGHYTTAPPALATWRERQVAAVGDPANAPDPDELVITDDDIRESIEGNQLRLMDERGSDVTVFSPRASFMAHHIGDLARLEHLGTHLQRPRPPGERALPRPLRHGRDAAAEPRRRPRDERARAAPRGRGAGRASSSTSTPTRAAATRTAPPLTDRSWYPVYEALVEYDVPAMIHVSHLVQPGVPHHRRALPRRRHDGVHAAGPGRPLRRLPDAALRHPARGRGGALPLGPVPGPGHGARPARTRRSCWATSSSTPASTTSPASTC